jgi:ATP-dependent helicase HrpA
MHQPLVLSADGVVDYARVDAAAAREIFIERALVEGELGAEPSFLTHNRDLLAQVRQWEERVRRHDLLADPAQLASFYRARLPVNPRFRQ